MGKEATTMRGYPPKTEAEELRLLGSLADILEDGAAKATAEYQQIYDGAMRGLQHRSDILQVKAYFLEKAHFKPRAPKVIEAIEKRIEKRLKEGFTVEDLKRAVDVANWDEFYLKQGYNKQAEVVFRSAERVQRLLSIYQREAERPIPL